MVVILHAEKNGRLLIPDKVLKVIRLVFIVCCCSVFCFVLFFKERAIVISY